jgi:hypothetical protein
MRIFWGWWFVFTENLFLKSWTWRFTQKKPEKKSNKLTSSVHVRTNQILLLSQQHTTTTKPLIPNKLG